MNINGYVLFFINTLDSIMRGVKCWLSRRLLGRGCLMWVQRKPNIHVTQPTLEPQGALPQALTFFGSVRLITWRLRHLFFFLEKCWQDLRHFWSHRVCLGYSLVPGPTLKRPCDVFVRLVGRTTNTNTKMLSCSPLAVGYLLHAAGE